MDKLKALVEMGAAPRNALEKVQSAIADQEDDAILKRTLYGALTPEETTEQQAGEMVDAARRRVERVQKRIADIKPLIEAGYYARTELTPLLEELDFRRRTFDLATSRAEFLKSLMEMAKEEQAMEPREDASGVKPMQERFDGNGLFGPSALRRVVLAYEKQFSRTMPISANGETAVHRALGFDHRGRVDVALSPDQTEGVWLRQFLEKEQIPYYAFRGAIAGKATAAHIHIGPPSLRLRVAD